jgi:FkbM family methyltransferase
VFLKLGARVVAVEPQPLCALILRVVFGRNGRVTVLRKALGAAEGTAQLRVSTASTISSMSTEWIDAVTRSGRFEGSRWTGRRKVAVATLDGLIQRWGEPSFVKIDVEGFEYEVLRGLSRPLAAVAFEFTPEFMSSALKCLNHLQQLGPYRFNYSLGESMEWGLDRWLDGREFATRLETLRDDTSVFGDIYARLP